jgi:hypothetical protein
VVKKLFDPLHQFLGAEYQSVIDAVLAVLDDECAPQNIGYYLAVEDYWISHAI